MGQWGQSMAGLVWGGITVKGTCKRDVQLLLIFCQQNQAGLHKAAHAEGRQD